MYGADNANALACNWVPVRPSCSEGQPREKRYHIARLADSFRALIEKSMSICASSSPGRLPARLKSPNEAWSRYLIPDSLSQSDFAAEVIHPSWAWRWAPRAACRCGGVVPTRLLLCSHAAPAAVRDHLKSSYFTKHSGLVKTRRIQNVTVWRDRKVEIKIQASSLMSYQSYSNYQFSSLKSCSCQCPSINYERAFIFQFSFLKSSGGLDYTVAPHLTGDD